MRDRGRRLAMEPLYAVLLQSTALLAPPDAQAADEIDVRVEVRVEVDKDGLKWTGPCSATFRKAGERDDERALVLEHRDLEAPARLLPGRYELQVACPSTEGTLAKTNPLTVGKRGARAKVRLRPAFLVVRAVRDGNEVPADVEVTDAYGRRVQQGRDKVALPVPAGRLRVTARVDPRAAGTRRPVLGTVEVTAKEGRKATPEIDTSDGTLVVTLLNNGRAAEGVAALRPPGRLSRLVELVPGAQPVPPGVYDVVAQLSEGHDFKEQVQRKVRIRPKQQGKVRFAFKTGRLEPVLEVDGAPLEEEAEVSLSLPGAPQAFNTLAPGEAALLTPGRYRVRARLLGRTLDDGGPWQAEADVTVRRGQTARPRLSLTPARLSLTTSVGKVPRPLSVAVFREAAKAPFFTARAPRAGPLALRLQAGGYRIVATLTAPQGELVVEQRVRLQDGQRAERALDLDVGQAVVQVFDDGVAVPAEVSFFPPGASAPSLTAPAGQEVHLPPGRYALRVRRGDEERTFGPTTVRAGQLIERQLELRASDGRPERAP